MISMDFFWWMFVIYRFFVIKNCYVKGSVNEWKIVVGMYVNVVVVMGIVYYV